MLRSAFRGKHSTSNKEIDPTVKADGSSCIQQLQDTNYNIDLEVEAVGKTVENSESKKSTLSELDDERGSLSEDSEEDSDRHKSSSKGEKPGKQNDSDGLKMKYSERAIYEMQLVKLQEELVTTMIENQDLGKQLEMLKDANVEKLVKELEMEKKKNKELNEKLKQKKKAGNQKLSRKTATRVDPRHSRCSKCSCSLDPEDGEKCGEEWVDLGHETLSGGRSPRTDKVDGYPQSVNGIESTSDGSNHVSSGLQTGDQVMEAAAVTQHPSKLENFKNTLSNVIVDRLYDFLNDEKEDDKEEDDDGEPLTVKLLKENINRFSNGIRPITSFVKSVSALISWQNRTATLLTFVIYMYAVWYGLLLPLILTLIIWKLSLNYLYARGIATQLGFPKKMKDEAPQGDDKTWSDRFQLVLQVARKVQNILGGMADSLEKLNNLFMWQHYEGSRKLFTIVLVAFFASLFLSGPTLFRMGALGFGVKMFIVRSIYNRFPKVKKRYDDTARLWEELPTDAQLAAREENGGNVESFENVSAASSNNLRYLEHHNGSHGNHSDGMSFHERMQISNGEWPLTDWEEGRRCTLMNKDRPLHNMKHGRLYLTQNYLCFERSKINPNKNIAIRLDSITQVSKYKPLTLLPGSGMALEISVRNKSFVFGGVIGRDEVYDLLQSAGRAANLAWATPSRIEEGIVRMGALAASSSRLHDT